MATAYRVFGGLAVGISCAIALTWALVDADWRPPAPHPAEVPAPPGMGAVSGVGGDVLVDIAERPLFLPDRRPPEPEVVEEPEPEPEPDPLAEVTLLGIYGSGGTAGVLLGKGAEVSRLRIGGEWQGWRLLSVSATAATLVAADGETQSLELERRPQLGGMVAAPAAGRPDKKAAKARQGSQAQAPQKGRPSTPAERQAALRAARERAARFNQSENKD